MIVGSLGVLLYSPSRPHKEPEFGLAPVSGIHAPQRHELSMDSFYNTANIEGSAGRQGMMFASSPLRL